MVVETPYKLLTINHRLTTNDQPYTSRFYYTNQNWIIL
ncbi:hypothetical protein SAMN06297358_1718 [Pedobacter xixiisoli]|uniref:Uncharacterized protein n=1 Tax=Pedobacter xixiisoli TaxID=1476464 RepID=A0A285ZYK0_9SPHI|nr:hypothetical protein SAMN06297358_1718 [Pedobacter xixiisoli]